MMSLRSSVVELDVIAHVYLLRSSDHHRFVRIWRAAATIWDARRTLRQLTIEVSIQTPDMRIKQPDSEEFPQAAVD